MQTLLKHFNSLSDKDRFVRLNKNVEKGLEKELQESDFKDMHPIGSGVFAEIIWAQHKLTNQGMALKKIEKKNLKAKNLIQKVQDEIDILNTMDHKHIIKLHNHFETKKFIYLVEEYANAGTLYKELQRSKDKKIPEAQALKWIKQIIETLAYMHNLNVIHKDLKSENILLHKHDEGQMASVKVCDFGWSNFQDKGKSTFGGTIEYISPEMLCNEPHTTKMDLWSLGILIYEILSGKTPFEPQVKQKNMKKMLETTRDNILKCKYRFPEKFPDGAKDLVTQLLKVKACHRISLVDVQFHPWITGIQTVPKELTFLDRLKQEKKHSLPPNQLGVYSDKNVERYQNARQKRRSQMSAQLAKYSTPQLLNTRKPTDSDSNDTGSSSSSDDSLKKKKKKGLERQKSLRDPGLEGVAESNEDLMTSQQSLANSQPSLQVIPATPEITLSRMVSEAQPPMIVVEDFDFQMPSQKKFKPLVLKSSGVDFDMMQSLTTPRIQELQSKLKLEFPEGRTKSQTNFQRLAQHTKQSCSLFEKEEQTSQHLIAKLKGELDVLTQEQQQLKLLLSLSTPNKPVPRDSVTEELYMRQSTVTYQNYDSESKVTYYHRLLSKLPNLKCEKFCLKNRLKDQTIQLIKLQTIQARNAEYTSELQQLQARKTQLSNFTEMFRKQIQEITDKTNYMINQTQEIETQEKIESQLAELQQKYLQHQSVVDTAELNTLDEELNEIEFRLRISKPGNSLARHNLQNLDLSSISISEHSHQFTSMSSDNLDQLIGGSMGKSMQMQQRKIHSGLSLELQNSLRVQEEMLEKKFTLKFSDLEHQYAQQKEAYDKKRKELVADMEQNSTIIRTRNDGELVKVQSRRQELMDDINKLTAKETPLKTAIEIQDRNLQFIEDQIRQMQNLTRRTLERKS